MRGLGRLHPQLDARVVRAQGQDGVGHDRRRGAGHGGQADLARDLAVALFEVGPGAGEQVDHRVGVVAERLAGAGEDDPARRTVEQRRAGLAFEHGQLLRDGRRGQAQRAGRAGDRAAPPDLAEQAQPADVEQRFRHGSPPLGRQLDLRYCRGSRK